MSLASPVGRDFSVRPLGLLKILESVSPTQSPKIRKEKSCLSNRPNGAYRPTPLKAAGGVPSPEIRIKSAGACVFPQSKDTGLIPGA